ncbi:MAG: NERD domain-containing protein [Anaerolineae bacterium]|nr:NERD domain-containing protein [Anaerolineae bacterium]
MRTKTNEKLVKRNRTIAQYLFFASFGILIAAFIINLNFNPNSTESTLILALPLFLLPLGLIATLASVRMTNLWVRLPRPEQALKDGLKGLSNKSVLYNYYHFPARHVLLCPQGVYAITVRYQDGSYTVKGDRWITNGGVFDAFVRIFRRDGIGNPTADAINAAKHVQKLIDPIASGVTVRPLIVFIDPRAQITVEETSIPILNANPKEPPNLIDYMRDIPKSDYISLTNDQIETFEEETIND